MIEQQKNLDGGIVGDLIESFSKMDDVKEAAKIFEGLTLEQQQTILSSKKLTETFRDGLLNNIVKLDEETGQYLVTAKGLTYESGKQCINMNAYEGALKRVEGQTKKLTISQFLLKNALTLTIAAIGIGITAYTMYSNYQKQLASDTRAAADAYASASESIADNTEKYKELHEELQKADTTEARQTEIKAELLEIQKSLNETYDDEKTKINLVTGEYEKQLGVIEQLNTKLKEKWLNENNKGYNQAVENLAKERDYKIANVKFSSDEIPEWKKIKEIIDSNYKGIISLEASGRMGDSFDLKIIDTTAKDASEIINNFMTDVRNSGSKLSDDILNQAQKTLGKANDIVSEYSDSANTGLNFQIEKNGIVSSFKQQAQDAVDAYNEALASGDEAKIAEAYEDFINTRNEMLDSYLMNKDERDYYLIADKFSDDEWVLIEDHIKSIFGQIDTRVNDFYHSFQNHENSNAFTDLLKGVTVTELESEWNSWTGSGSKYDDLFNFINSDDFEVTFDEVIDLFKDKMLIFEDEASKTKHFILEMNDELLSELAKKGNNNKGNEYILSVRPEIDTSTLENKGFSDTELNADALQSKVVISKDGTQSFVVSPVLPNGEILDKATFDEYVQKLTLGEPLPLGVDLVLGSFDGQNVIGQAQAYQQLLANKDEFAYDNLIKMANKGILNAEYIESHEEFQNVLEATGYDAQALVEVIYELAKAESTLAKEAEKLTFSDMIGGFKTLEDQITNVDALYKEFKSEDNKDKPINTRYSIEALAALKDAFVEVEGINVDDFIDGLTQTGVTTEETQELFNDFVDELIQVQFTLNGTNEQTKQAVAAQLKQLGVTNSLDVAEQGRIRTKAEEIATTVDLTDKTESEILALETEAGVTDDTREAFRLYIAQKLLDEAIKTDGDISNLVSLMATLGVATEEVYKFQRARADLLAYEEGGKVDVFGQTMYKKTEKRGGKIVTSYITPEQFYALQNNDETSAEDAFESVQDKIAEYTRVNFGGLADNSNNKDSGGSSSSEPTSTIFDWIERRIEVVNKKIEDTKAKIDDLVTYKSKNAETDNAIEIMTEQLNTYQAAEDRYMSEAASIGLPQSYIDKIQQGIMDIETITENSGAEESASITKRIEKYKEWYNKAQDMKTAQEELRDSIRELNIQKLENIIHDFDSLNGLVEAYTDYREGLISLKEKSGESIMESDYTELIKGQNVIYENLKTKYSEMEKQFNELVRTGEIEKYSDEWFDYKEQLIGVQSEMNECTEAVLEFKEQIIDLRFKEFTDFNTQIEHINDSLSSLSSLLGEDGLVIDGMVTDKGLAKIALYEQQLSNSKKQAAEYGKAIETLRVYYENGDITLDQYNERLREYQSAQNQAALSTKEARDAIIALNEQAIQQQIEDMGELIQKKKDALNAEKELADYQEGLAKKQKAIATLQAKIAALSMSQSREDQALKLQLEQELKEAQKELADTQADHELEVRQEALDKELEDYTDKKNAEIEELKTNLTKQDELIKDYLEKVTNNHDVVYDKLTEYGTHYGMEMTEQLTTPWESATTAATLFADTMGEVVAKIVYELSKIDVEGFGDVLDKVGATGYIGSGASSTDVTGKGSWQQAADGKRWWYGTEDESWYAKGGTYTIDGKEYNFDDDGYMKTGWDDSTGQWRYFSSSSGELKKSVWIPDKEGKNWYFLDHNGNMATNASIKAEDGSGYYIVNKDGIWDGKLTSEEDVDLSKYPNAYYKGTKSARPGLAFVNERGQETMMTKKGDLISLKGGESIFTAQQTANLHKLSKLSVEDLLSKVRINPSMMNNSGDVNINSPLFEVHGGLDSSMKAWVEQQIDAIPDKIGKFKKIRKF